MYKFLSKTFTARPAKVAFFIGKLNVDYFPKVAVIREDPAAVNGRETAFGISVYRGEYHGNR